MTVAGVYIDEALVFVLTFIAILGVWSALNRWEGERQYRCIVGERAQDEADGEE